jgi:hypothetical protein
MKPVLIVLCTVLLPACSSAPVMRASFNGSNFTSAPTSKSDPRLGQPRFYSDESDSISWLHSRSDVNTR